MSKGDVRQLVWFGLKPFYFEDIMSILYILDLQMLHFPFLSHLLNLNVFCKGKFLSGHPWECKGWGRCFLQFQLLYVNFKQYYLILFINFGQIYTFSGCSHQTVSLNLIYFLIIIIWVHGVINFVQIWWKMTWKFLQRLKSAKKNYVLQTCVSWRNINHLLITVKFFNLG